MAGRNKKKNRSKGGFVNTGSEKKTNAFYIFGRKPIFEKITKTPTDIKVIYIIGNQDSQDLEEIIFLAKSNKIRLEYINQNTAIGKVGKVNMQGVIASIGKYKYADQLDWELEIRKKKKPEMVLVLDHIEDVGNYGAIIRTAAAVGVSAIFVAGDRQAPVNGTVFKTSAGNISKVKIIKVSNLGQIVQKLKDLKFWVYAVDMPENSRGGNIWDQKFDTHTAFILGAEGKGVSEKLREKSDFVVPIPMENGVESLNVSVSAALAMYEWRRQQK